MSQTLYVTFPDTNHAQRAVAALFDNGVSSNDVTIVSNDPNATNQPTGTGDDLGAASRGVTTTTPADAGKGAAEGAGIGLGLGILAGLASLIVPGFGLVLGGGALAAALGIAGATTAGGAIVGAVTGSLIDMGVPADTAQVYSDRLQSGGSLVAVTLPSGDVDVATGQDILRKYDASDINIY